MDPAALINLALIIINGALKLIDTIKSQHGLTNDQILAQAQQMTDANDNLYATLKASLGS